MSDTSKANPWDKALDWPSIHGVWWASYIKKPRSYRKVFAFMQAGKMQVVFPDGGSPIRGYWKFIPANVEQPPPLPKPAGPWDYVPKVGDWVWAINPVVDDKPTGPHQVKSTEAAERDLTIGYRFAKAEFLPPPQDTPD